MELISTTLSIIKQHRIQFSISWLLCLVALFILTSLSMLKILLARLDSANQIQLFTTKEINQMQHYFSSRLAISSIGLFFLLLIFFGLRIHHQKKRTVLTKQLVYSVGLEFIFELLLATLCFILLFALFEPVYETILQHFYHQGLNQLKELPPFVLSNGTSGIAYSIRSSLSFELTSAMLLDLFFSSLFKALGYLFVSLGLIIISFRMLGFINKNGNVR
ncbi:hypothetical protein CF160_05575 [Enterococcus pseudoavium]|nr:hypothetical protein CF160_05575 [Enterococcus pseudoavium]